MYFRKQIKGIVVDAGHGGDDPGASGNGIIEKEYRTKLVRNTHVYIPPKTLTPVSKKVSLVSSNTNNYNYTVIDGTCYINLWGIDINSNLSAEILFDNLPKSTAYVSFILSDDVGSKTVGLGWIDAGSQSIRCSAKLEAGTTNSQGYIRFSYPVDTTWIPS